MNTNNMPGMTVELRSGGPKMTVLRIKTHWLSQPTLIVGWFDDTNRFHEREVSLGALVLPRRHGRLVADLGD
jgi:uncharacterized protein YodC (DUF2158 family)